jgi:hypothetical protein
MTNSSLQRFDHDGIELINSIPRPVKALPQLVDMPGCQGKYLRLFLAV